MPTKHLSEYQLARQWRESRGLSRPQLARLIHFSASRIEEIEVGQSRHGKPIDPDAFARYKLACAAIAAGVVFDWTSARVPTLRAVRQPRKAKAR